MRLINYVEELEKKGRIFFTRSEAMTVLSVSPNALRRSIDRLVAKKRLHVIKSEFIIIVPISYQEWGIVPATWFIDPLMKHLKVSYYIALLTGAQCHGAAHQKPMVFQVITDKQLKPIRAKRVEIEFHSSGTTKNVPTQKMQVESGYAFLGTVETTALDICKYYQSSGYFSNIATILTELQDKIDVNKLYNLANSGLYEVPVIQRLGYLLSMKEVEGAHIARPLINIVKNHARWVYLQPEGANEKGERDNIWKIYINKEIEVEV